MKIGLYFGSFNPVHTGHLIIASHILNATDLEKVWLVISPHNPFKKAGSLLNEYDRLHLAQLAVDGNDSIRAIDIEFTLPKPSYTTHTLTYLAEKYPAHQFSIIMGSDSFQNLQNWKNAPGIIAHYPILVYKRPGFEIADTYGAKVTVMDAPLLEISATHIRGLVETGKSIRYLVPEKVEREIIESRFYKKTQNK